MPKTHRHKGRGATLSPDNRYSECQNAAFDDGWSPQEQPQQLKTELFVDKSKTVITYNQSPDVPFDRSINPYRGCEHGCVYCFARPTHAWLDLSPGLDFETQLFYKADAPALLTQELAKQAYRCAPLSLGVNTDAYQPVERKLKLTRQLLEILVAHRHPVVIITKSSLIERDIDLLTQAAKNQLIEVVVSLTTSDRQLSRIMEPRAAAPERRLVTISRLRQAGIPVSVLIAPLIPVLNESELETLLESARRHDALDARYVLLRLPHELDEMFIDWLQQHTPLKAEHIMNRIRDMRSGKTYDSTFGTRMHGSGPYAELIAQRYKLTHRKLGYPGSPSLRSDLFVAPNLDGQLQLF